MDIFPSSNSIFPSTLLAHYRHISQFRLHIPTPHFPVPASCDFYGHISQFQPHISQHILDTFPRSNSTFPTPHFPVPTHCDFYKHISHIQPHISQHILDTFSRSNSTFPTPHFPVPTPCVSHRHMHAKQVQHMCVKQVKAHACTTCHH